MIRSCFFLLAVVLIGCTGYTQPDGIDLDDGDSIFAFIGDNLTVFCNCSSLQAEGLNDDLIRISIFRHGKLYRDFSNTRIVTKPEKISSLSSTSSSSSSSSSSWLPLPSSSSLSQPSPSLSSSSSTSSSSLPPHLIAASEKRISTEKVVAGVITVTEDLLGMNSVVCQTSGQRMLQEATLYVQGAISNISAVSSVWFYSHKRLRVNWTWGWPNVDKFMDVNAVWTVGGPPNQRGIPCTNKQQTSCIINNLRFPNIIYFRVNVVVKDALSFVYHGLKKNGTGSVTSSSLGPGFRGVFNFHLNPSDSVKTDPPSEFRLASKSSHCLNVTWSNPPYFRHNEENSTFSIEVTDVKKKDLILTKISNTTDNDNQNNPTVSLCDLEADVLHRMTLKVKPIGRGYWSEQALLFAKTREDKPDHGPEIADTSFWSGPCMSGERRIIIYWKDIPHRLANGDLTNFVIKFTLTEFKARPNANHVSVHLPCNKTYLVEVYSATRAGRTDFPSQLIVPSERQEMEAPGDLRFKVIKMDDAGKPGLLSVNVTWVYPFPATGFTYFIDIYYCRGETFSTNICIDEIQYQRVPLQDETFLIVNISDATDRFGYALADGLDNVRGITWTNCVVDARKRPTRPTGVTAFRDNSDNSALVKWNSPLCGDANGALVSTYRVIYCKLDSSQEAEHCLHVSVDGSASSVQLSGLDIDSLYTVTVVAVSGSMNSSSSLPFTLDLTPMPKTTDNLERNLLIIFGIFLLLVMAALLGCFLRRIRQRMILVQKDFQSLKVVSVTNSYLHDSGCNISTDSSGLSAPESLVANRL